MNRRFAGRFFGLAYLAEHSLQVAVINTYSIGDDLEHESFGEELAGERDRLFPRPSPAEDDLQTASLGGSG